MHDVAFGYAPDIVAKAHQQANMIRRCFVSCSTELLLLAYVAYVRSLLEYNTTVWSPGLKRSSATAEIARAVPHEAYIVEN